MGLKHVATCRARRLVRGKLTSRQRVIGRPLPLPQQPSVLRLRLIVLAIA
jgi:hypothetical protein